MCRVRDLKARENQKNSIPLFICLNGQKFCNRTVNVLSYRLNDRLNSQPGRNETVTLVYNDRFSFLAPSYFLFKYCFCLYGAERNSRIELFSLGISNTVHLPNVIRSYSSFSYFWQLCRKGHVLTFSYTGYRRILALISSKFPRNYSQFDLYCDHTPFSSKRARFCTVQCKIFNIV